MFLLVFSFGLRVRLGRVFLGFLLSLLFGRGLAGWVPALCAMCGMEEIEARLAVQALASMILGLAILQPDDMAAFVEAEPGASPEAVLALAEAHVARTAVRLLTP